jgi:trans-aconitate methyltransferase
MDQFKSKLDAHDHSLRLLELIGLYDDFMDSITVIADMGCGSGLDIEWWATAENRDEPPVPYNYVCYAVDKDISQLDKDLPTNVHPIEADFSDRCVPRSIDLLWSHDSFQYSTNPLGTLKNWNESMSENGMLVLTVPQFSNYQYNRYMNRVYDGCFFNHNVCGLIYMLAVNGFDCKDAYIYKAPNDPWIHAAVYKSSVAPMDPTKTRWYDLIDAGLVNDSVAASVNQYGYLRQEDIIYPWLDRDFYYVQD